MWSDKGIIERSVYYLPVVLLLTLVVMAVSEWIGLSNLVKSTPPYTVPDVSQILGAVGSILLSIYLVILYQKQLDLQREQQNILQEQHSLQEKIKQFEHKSDVRVRGPTSDGGQIAIEVLNKGPHPIFEPQIGIELLPAENSEVDGTISWVDVFPGNPGEPEGAYRVKRMRASESWEPVYCFPRFKIKSEQDILFGRTAVYKKEYHNADYLVEELSEIGARMIHLRFYFRYFDKVGDENKFQISDIVMGIRPDTSFNSLYEYSVPYEHFLTVGAENIQEPLSPQNEE